MFAFLLHLHLLKISNQKATISKETIAFDVWMAAILGYIKHVLQQDVTFRVCKWPITIETVVIKLNEIKLKCLEWEKSKLIKVDLKL